MNRVEFGELIATLREDLGWTQAELAELLELNVSTISNIERGTKRHLDPQLLFNLAQALQLTHGERQQLYLAASALDEVKMMRPTNGYSPDQVIGPSQKLEQLLQIAARLRIPCFLVDVYQEVVAANAIIAELFKFRAERVDELRKIPGALTVLWLIQSEGQLVGPAVTERWEAFAINNMRLFRESSLRYRARPYFKYLMKEFRNPTKYPGFQRYWRLASTLGPDEESRLNEYTYSHPEYGRLSYHVFSSLSATRHGELYLYQLVPTDEHTTDVFEALARDSGDHVIRMAPWPDKPME